MTKEQLYVKWLMTPDLKSDIEAVIATEIAKVKEPQPEELKGNCSTFDMSRLVDQEYKPAEQPAINPIEQAYERGEKIRHKNWLNGDWIQKHKETKTINNYGHINSVYPFAFIQYPEKWELYTEPTEQVTDQVTDQVKHAKPFDKDRFEAMFRAVVARNPQTTSKDCIIATEKILAQLDAYYATKNN